MLTGLLLAMMVVVLRFPETALARWVQRMMIDAPRERLAKLERRHLIFVALMTLIVLAGGELLAMVGPFDMALVVLWDVSTYIDILLTGTLVATTARSGAGVRAVVARLRLQRRPRARRCRPARKALAPANDDDRRGCALAA